MQIYPLSKCRMKLRVLVIVGSKRFCSVQIHALVSRIGIVGNVVLRQGSGRVGAF